MDKILVLDHSTISFSLLLLLLLRMAIHLMQRPTRPRSSRRLRPDPPQPSRLNQPKPKWVPDEVLRLKALMPHNGCRKIATTFNWLHHRRGVTVGKSYVAQVLQREGYRIAEIRRCIRRRKPRPVPRNLTWGLDLTYTRHRGRSRPLLGILDHGTRACLALRQLPSKGSIVILRALLDVVENHGKPKTLRTDNEAIFTSRLFRLGLWILGIRHQRTAPFAPWQDGRIERFFGTFKRLWRLRDVVSSDLQADLEIFSRWYNHIRPHNNLDGRTPAMAWHGKEPRSRGRPKFVSGWDGILAGFYFPL